MIARPFRYKLPLDLGEAASLLAGGADASSTVILGGGTVAVPEMTAGRQRPSLVLDLRRCGLASICVEREDVIIGACATYADILSSAVIASRLPLLRVLAGAITGGAQIHNRGTIGGSACYANPASDVPAALVALGARLRCTSVAGTREVPAGNFFGGAFATTLRSTELLAEMVIEPQEGRWGYSKFKLSESSGPIVTAAYIGDRTGAQVVLGGIQETPLRVPLDFGDGDAKVSQRVATAIEAPWSDVLADGEYRRAIAPVIARRAYAHRQVR